MGPTNEALVKLFHADQKCRLAQSRYDAASRDVRIQERKVSALVAKHEATTLQLREQQAKSGTTDLDIKSREIHIEKLRDQQQTTKNNKEYQAFLIQINTEKADKSKSEDALLYLMGAVETLQAEIQQLVAQIETESQKMKAMSEKITERLASIQAEIDRLTPLYAAAASEVSAAAMIAYKKLADRFEGEAMAPIEKPDKRVEEYTCGVCNMSMMADMYNRLHTRDEPLCCPSCRRLLYIPDDLPPERAINQRKKPKKGAAAEKENAEQEAAK